uniref:Uncharacterized protein n=1 Tax=Triticum urartu TaxID=4572 RepID=A0A8R7UI82_TRIUA
MQHSDGRRVSVHVLGEWRRWPRKVSLPERNLRFQRHLKSLRWCPAKPTVSGVTAFYFSIIVPAE